MQGQDGRITVNSQALAIATKSLGDAKTLYYSAGPNKEFDGVFGRINVVSSNSESQK